MDARGWPWFLAWALPGLTVGLQVSAIGLLVAPVGLILIWLLMRKTGFAGEAFGMLLGIALVVLFIAWANVGPGDLNALSWGVVGFVFSLAAVGGYASVISTRKST